MEADPHIIEHKGLQSNWWLYNFDFSFKIENFFNYLLFCFVKKVIG